MKFPVIHLSFLPVSGMALFPFILIKHAELKLNRQIIHHEKIHLRQQLELLIIPFYILYLLNYLINLLYYRSHFRAYKNIIFEREAYENDKNPDYLSRRKFAAWFKYLSEGRAKSKKHIKKRPFLFLFAAC